MGSLNVSPKSIVIPFCDCRLSGGVHEVFTGVTLLRPPTLESSSKGNAEEPLVDQFYERTEVKFGQLSEQLIRAYIATKEPL